MKVLVLNCGSSSIKFQLIEMDTEEVLAKGQTEKIGSNEAIFNFKPKGKDKLTRTQPIPSHDVAIEVVLSSLMDPDVGVIKSKTEIDGIGHRLVHGGEEFVDSVLIDTEVKEGVRRCIQFAPLHNPHNLHGVEACEQLLPGIPQVGVFDTAFHHTLPAKAYIYALPLKFYRKHKIRRYGFHGTSHAYVARKAAEHVGKPIESLKIITCHLGNGASITAVDQGHSVETSMGFTPLEGLVMGTRCGDMDPALIPYIANLENLNLAQVDSLLNKKSGMLGLTEKTAGIGEHSPLVRSATVQNLDYLGIRIDEEKNKANAFDISSGKVKVLVVPTNEELAIARDTQRILKEHLK